MSTADTIREYIKFSEESHLRGKPGPREAEEALDALLAELDWFADRAVCSGCGQDVGESGICTTPECDNGEMIPASDLPGALLHACEDRAQEREEWRSDWEALRAEAKALEAALETLADFDYLPAAAIARSALGREPARELGDPERVDKETAGSVAEAGEPE